MSATRVVLVACAFAWAGLAATANAQSSLTYADLVRAPDRPRGAGGAAGRRASSAPSGRATTGPASTTRRPASTSTGTPTATATASSARRASTSVMAEMEGPGLHLADLVGPAAEGPREDLSRRQRTAGRRSALRRLLRRQARAVQLPELSYRPGRRQVPAARTSIFPSPTRNRARSWPTTGWGALLPLRLRDVPQGTQVPTFSPELADGDTPRR